MIIRNEKDRLKAMRLLEDAEFPCVQHLTPFINNEQEQYLDSPEPELGSHNSGMEAEEYW